jgi:hypothetical protein
MTRIGPTLDELIDDLVKAHRADDREARMAAYKRAVSHYPEGAIVRRLRARYNVVSLAKVRGWCGCPACRITREAWEARPSRQSVADFIAEHAPPNYHSETWVSLAWIAEHGAPLAKMQAKSILFLPSVRRAIEQQPC